MIKLFLTAGEGQSYYKYLVMQLVALSHSTKPGDCARLVSAGPIPGRNIQFNGIDATINDAAADDRGNDRVLFLQISDPHQGGNKPCNEY